MAEDYIVSTLASYGYTPRLEEFEITVPIDDGAEVSIISGSNSSNSIIAYQFLPNTVNPSSTPPEGITGELIDVGLADISTFTNKTIEGNIVLIDYENSRWFWKNALMFGAKGIIFIEPNFASQKESMDKLLKVPIGIPRVIIPKEEAFRLRTLLQSGVDITVRLTSRMHWENVKVANIIAIKQGIGAPQEHLVFSSWYDSYSVVPSIAPGATDALNVATLLEVAKFFSDQSNVHKRSVMFAFLAGHGQNSWGAKEFVENHFYEIGTLLNVFMGLDLAYDSRLMAIYARGSTYEFKTPPEGAKFGWLNDQVIKYAGIMRDQLQKTYSVESGIFPVTSLIELNPLFFDSDPFTLAGGAGVTLHTTSSARSPQMTPTDRAEFIDYSNFIPQAEYVLGMIHALAQEPYLPISTTPIRIAADAGFATIKGHVGLYNLTVAWYDPFSHPGTIIHVQWRTGTLIGGAVSFETRETPTVNVYVKPGPDGTFYVKGVKPFTPIRVEAYVIDEKGRLLYATDFGVYGLGKGYPTPPVTPTTPGGAWIWPNQEEMTIWLPVFRVASIALLDLVDPTTMTVRPLSIMNYNFLSHSWNLQHSEDIFQSDAIVFFPSSNPVELIINVQGTKTPLAVLSNMTLENPSGSGYTVSEGETMVFTNTPYIIAKQFWILTESRVSLTSTYHVYSSQVKDFHPKATAYLKLADKGVESMNYALAYSTAISSWSYVTSSYSAAMSLVIDVITTVVFFFLLMIPFAYLLQKLMLPEWTGMRRLGGFIALFLASTGVLWVLHPGFHIAFNVFMIALSAALTVLAVIVYSMVVQGATGATRAYQAKVLGLHYAELSRSATTMLAFTTGIQNLRKRKFRTTLTIISLVTMATGLIVLTSSSFLTFLIVSKSIATTPYNGVLLRDTMYSPQSEEMAQMLKALYSMNATVSERTWVIPPIEFNIKPGVTAQALFGLTPQEENLTPVSASLLQGRWFEAGEDRVLIISKSMAQNLGVGIGGNVTFLGINLVVIGIYDADAWTRIKDLDQQPIVPMKMIANTPVPVPAEQLLIVPYTLILKEFNYFPVIITAKFQSASETLENARSLALQVIRVAVFAGVEGEITYYHPFTFYGVSGLQFMVPAMIIAGFTVLNVMLASVHERLKEIYILSAVGLSPRSISGMFFAESTLFAMLSAVVGYIMGMVVLSSLDLLKLIPPDFTVNYASTFVLVCSGIIILTTLVSSAFPSLRASRLATPSLKRRWEITTKPSQDHWNIPLPFVAESKEGPATLLYLQEFVESSTAVYGVFAAEAQTVSLRAEEGKVNLGFETALAPFDLAIREHVDIIAIEQEGKFNFSVALRRTSGVRDTWILANYPFIDRLRKQFLLWRTLTPDQKNMYIKRVEETLKN